MTNPPPLYSLPYYTMSLLCCPCLSWANLSRSPGAICDSNVMSMSPMSCLRHLQRSIYSMSYRSYPWLLPALCLTGAINDFSELTKCPMSCLLTPTSYISVSPERYMCRQWTIYVSKELPVFPVSHLFLQLAFCVPNELYVSPVSYLCLQWAVYVSKELSVSPVSYLCLQLAFANELSMSPVSDLCVQWAMCVSSELSVSPVSNLCLQWAICVSNELSVSPVSDLCLQWAICVSSELCVFPVSYPLFNDCLYP